VLLLLLLPLLPLLLVFLYSGVSWYPFQWTTKACYHLHLTQFRRSAKQQIPPCASCS
jgi:hypothetical protein